MNPLLEAALTYARAGWHVFPCEPPIIGDETSGKAPIGGLVPNGKDDASTDERIIRLWWHARPDANIGVNSERSGVMLLDVDVGTYTDKKTGEVKQKQGAASLATIQGELTHTRFAKTGGGGRHLIYARGEREPRQALGIRDGLDIIGKGYFIAAPSKHWSGGTYEWLNDAPLAPAPDVLFTLQRASKNTNASPVSDLASLPEKSSRVVAASLIANVFPPKGRHNTFLALAGALASSGWDETSIAEFTTMVAQLLSYESEADKAKALNDRGAQAHDAVALVQSGGRPMSWGTLGKMLGEAPIVQAMERLGIEEGGDFEFVTEATLAARDALASSALSFLETQPEEPPAKPYVLVGELAQRKYPPVVSYSTGFGELDRLLGGGYSTQQMIVMLGKPGAGKTAFVIGTALHVEPTVPVLYASTELQHNEIIARLAAPIVGCAWRDIVRNKAVNEKGEPVTHEMVAAALAGKRIAVLDQDAIYKAGTKAVELVARTALAMKEDFGVAPLIMVDYMQEMARADDKEGRYAANTAVAVAFRMISQRLDCAVVTVSSVNRNGYGAQAQAHRQADDPTVYLAFAKESGDIDYAAATICFVDVADEHDGFGWKPGRIAVAKSRHGEVGFAGVRFHGATGRWEAFNDGVAALSGNAQIEQKAAKRMEEDEQRIVAKVRELRAYGPEHLLDKSSLVTAVGINTQRGGQAIERLVVKKQLVKLRQQYADASKRMQTREVIDLGESVESAANPRTEEPVSIGEIFNFGPT
jgi:KaiC/GvpD/RAD55 family RecA-like ATPase